jgi:hypothetical protein
MACPEFENLLSGGDEKHVLQCEECRALLDALAQVDSTFEAAFAGICAPAGLHPHLSPIPEVLDLIGWAAVLATVAFVLPYFT